MTPYLTRFPLALVLVFTLRVSVAAARTVTVDTTADNLALSFCTDAQPGDCSLRGAIAAANAAAEHFDIELPSGTYAATAATPCTFDSAFDFDEVFTGTTFCIKKDVAIIGSGSATTILDGFQSARVVAADKNAVVAISGVTITRGFHTGGTFNGSGAGIINHGTMILADVVVTGNASGTGGGGGVRNAGTLAVVHSTIAGNTSMGEGGGINNEHVGSFGRVSAGSLTVIDSTIADNGARSGGGIASSGSIATITGSTLSGNIAEVGGGGIFNFTSSSVHLVNSTLVGNDAFNGGAISNGAGCPSFACPVTLNNVTIVGNTADRGAGISNSEQEVVSLQNTILAGNTVRSSALGPDCLGGTLTSGGYNILGDVSDCSIAGDLSGNQQAADPQLGALGLNGGPTATRSPLAGSPALDGGSPAEPGSGGSACAVADQRRALRPSGARCDVGAFERPVAFGIDSLTPKRAGGLGSAFVSIAGGGFATGATVALRRAGHADIVADPVATEASGAALAATFDLTGADLGAWDVVVTNPDAASVALSGGFEIEAARAPDLFAVVLARSAARAGVPARFAVLLGNRGNTEALGVPLTLGLPAGFVQRFAFDVSAPPAQIGQPYNDYAGVPVEVSADHPGAEVDVPLLIPVIPAGFSGLLSFTLRPPGAIPPGTEFAIEALLGTPWFRDGILREDVVAEAAPRARGFAERGLGVVASSDLDPALMSYERDALTLAVSEARAGLVDDFGQIRRVQSTAYFAIDLAGYAAALATANPSPLRYGWLPHLLPQLVDVLGLGTSVAEAETVCPPCVCGAPVRPGCTSCDCKKPPPNNPKKPPDGLTPAECRDQPGHIVSADGERCKPDGSRDCPKLFGNPFSSDPHCRTYPIRNAVDPNDKAGSIGAGTDHFVRGGTPMPYMVAFENQPTATLAAQTVVVTDQLDAAVFDLDTFALGPILIGDVGITPPPGLATFSGGADLRPAHAVLVRVDAGLDKTTGLVTWRFMSLDPSTMEPLTDPDEGFLPPNTNPPAGDGQVHFTILPKSGLATGTQIRNHASIVFDYNAAIETPEWLNTIDATPPASRVDAAQGTTCDATDLMVRWSATDAGSQVASYSVFVSEEHGPFVALVTDTSDTSAPFTGVPGRTYGFYSVARDRAGNVEQVPATPDVARTIGLCAGDCNGDGMVFVNELILAVLIALDPTGIQVCGSLDVNGDGLVDIAELVGAVGHALTGCPCGAPRRQ